jgi:hypothetical protein
MTRRSLTFSILGAMCALLIATGSALAALSAVHGYAAAVTVDVTPAGGERVVGGSAGAGPLESTGGSDSNGGLSTCVPTPGCAIVETGERGASSAGEIRGDAFVSSTASTRDVTAFDGLVTGTLARADCAVDAAGTATGSARLENVTINGNPVAAEPAANLSVELLDAAGAPAGHVVVNEQVVNGTQLTVNALHIKLDAPGGSLGTGDVLLSHVECGSTVAPEEEPSDTTAPWTSRPSVRIVPNSSLGSRVLARITWRAGDEGGSGIARYRVQQRINGGEWATINSTTSTRSLDRYFTPGKTRYQLRVQAFDAAGNRSPWAEGPVVIFPVLQDGSRQIDYRGQWRAQRLAGASGGSATTTRMAGATATLTFRSRAIAVVAPTGPGYDSLRIWVDGKEAATVSLESNSRRERVVVYSTSWGAWSQHTVTIEAVGSRTLRRVTLDALIIGG